MRERFAALYELKKRGFVVADFGHLFWRNFQSLVITRSLVSTVPQNKSIISQHNIFFP